MGSIEFLRNWEGITGIKDIKIGYFPIWYMMDEFVHYAYNYYPNVDDIYNDINLDRRPSFKQNYMDIFLYARHKRRKKNAKKLNKEIPKNKRIVFIGSYSDEPQDPYMAPIMDHFQDYTRILIDIPSKTSSWDTERIKQKAVLQKHQNIYHRALEQFSEKESVIKWDYDCILKEYAKWKESIPSIFFIRNMMNQFDFFMDVRFKDYLRQYHALTNMLEELQPEVIVNPSEGGPTSNILYYLCDLFKIPIISIQHGSLRRDAKLYHIDREFPKATKVCVWGKKQKEFMIEEAKYKSSEIEITGSQAYDGYKMKYDKAYLCEKWGLNPDYPIYLVVDSSKTYKEKIEHFKKLKEEGQVLIKLHPFSDGNYPGFTNIKHGNLGKLIYISDAVFMYCSTVGLLSSLYDKPLMLLPKFSDCPNINMELGTKLDFNDIKGSIRKEKKKSKKRKKYAKENYKALDGGSSERIANVIKKVLNAKYAYKME